MTDSTQEPRRKSPFVDLLGLRFTFVGNGSSQCMLEVNDRLMNPNRVLHGGVVYSMADTGMGAALHSLLEKGETCATVEIKIVYLKAVTSGILTCETKVLSKEEDIAVMESFLRNGS
ncbi:MAG: PaaI family thioesterase, partial [Acidobacteriota bacterium]